MKVNKNLKIYTMKRFLVFVSIIFLLAACTKPVTTSITTYHIVNDCAKAETTIPYLDNTMWEVIVFCFSSADSIVRQDNIDSIAPQDSSKYIEVASNINRVIVSFKLLPKKSDMYNSTINARYYTVKSFDIIPETDNEIILNGKTELQKTLLEVIPSKQIMFKNISDWQEALPSN
jgi:hypothetical protein